MESTKARHFIKKTGVVQFERPFILEHESSIQHPENLKGLRPFYNMSIVELGSAKDNVGSDPASIRQQLTSACENAKANNIPIFSDSALKKFPTSTPYRCAMFSVPFETVKQLPVDSLKNLQVLGAVFVKVDVKKDGIDTAKMNAFRTISLHPIVECDDITQVGGLAKSFGKGTMYIVTKLDIDTSLIREIQNQGGFVFFKNAGFVDDDHSHRTQKVMHAENLKNLKDAVTKWHLDHIIFGAYDGSYFDECRKAGLTNFDLQNLLYYNFKKFMDGDHPPPMPTRSY